MKRLVLGVVIVAAAFLGSACGKDSDSTGGGTEAPEKAFERQIRYLADGQAGRAYRELHPAHQALISESLYVKCVGEGGSIEINSIKVKDVYDEEITIPGTSTRVPSKAITATIDGKIGFLKQSGTDTYHEILVDGAWRFVISDVEPYKAGECP